MNETQILVIQCRKAGADEGLECTAAVRRTSTGLVHVADNHSTSMAGLHKSAEREWLGGTDPCIQSHRKEHTMGRPIRPIYRPWWDDYTVRRQ